MTGSELSAFYAGIALGVFMGLFVGLVVIPLVVDFWARVIRARHGR